LPFIKRVRTKKMIILASASPRRKEILSELGVDFSVVVADTDESSDIRDPVALTEELARRKGLAVYERLKKSGEYDADSAIIISADTVVCRDGEILGKPRDREDAIAMLTSLSGRAHTVVSGVAVTVRGVARSASSVTTVRVQDIPLAEIEKYVDSGEPMDKAGAYGIQGRFSVFVEGIDGCYFGVVGLPVNTLSNLYFEVTGERLS
jgi:septum formation protein